MSEFTWDKFWGAVGGALALGYASIPLLMWVLVGMMALDFAMGTAYAISRPVTLPGRVPDPDRFSISKFGNGIIKKMAVFLMLGGVRLMAKYVLEMEGNPLELFAKGVMCYEFLSMCDTYIKFGGPGYPVLQGIASKVRVGMALVFGSTEKPLDQETVAAKLEAQKQAGQLR